MQKIAGRECFDLDKERLFLDKSIVGLHGGRESYKSERNVKVTDASGWHWASTIIIELVLGENRILKEIKVIDNEKALTAKFDKSGNLIPDEWFNEHPDKLGTAKDYESRIKTLIHNLTMAHKIAVEIAPKELFKQLIKKEEVTPPTGSISFSAKPKEPTLKRRELLSPEERRRMEERILRIMEICKEHGLEEKEISPHVFKRSPKTVEENIKVFEKHGKDWREFQYHIGQSPKTLDLNLQTCDENNINIKEAGASSKLALPHEKFKEFLRAKGFVLKGEG